MTTVTFHASNGRMDGVVVDGHSGYADAGSDIVCAAISSTVGLLECTLNEVLGLGAPVKVKEEEAHLSLRLPTGLSQGNEHTSQNLMVGLMVYLQALSQEYPENLIVLVDDDDED